jgi:hypothetical protein
MTWDWYSVWHNLFDIPPPSLLTGHAKTCTYLPPSTPITPPQKKKKKIEKAYNPPPPLASLAYEYSPPSKCIS